MITITYKSGSEFFTETFTRAQAKAWLQNIYGVYPHREVLHVDYLQSGLCNVAADRDWLDRMDGVADVEGYDYDADPHW